MNITQALVSAYITFKTIGAHYLAGPREERVCSECPSSVEDEHHVVFQCPLYRNVQMKHQDLLLRLKSIPELLNPTNIVDASEVGDLLLGINDIRRKLGLC